MKGCWVLMMFLGSRGGAEEAAVPRWCRAGR